jgi:dihydroxyacetone kinase phosphoprotein-dependent L subunit
VHKVAGAAAEAGRSLDEVARRAQRVADTVGTMGLALTPCTVPAAGQPGFLLDGDEIEWGLGIHGEPGVERAGMRPADEVVERLVTAIVADRGIKAGARVALLVNGLGATPPMELSIVAGAAARDLRGRGIAVDRVWAGNFLTALDMAGCSLSVLPVDDDVLAALDAPTAAPAWPGTVTATESAVIAAPSPAAGAPTGTLAPDDPVRRALEAVAEAMISVRDELTELDREVGDGDLGISLARGSAAVLADCPTYPGQDGPAAVLRATSATLRRSIGGTSGPLYAIMLLRAAAALPSSTPQNWAAAFHAGVAGVREVGGAELGDRTMVDALSPAADAFEAAVAGGAPWREALSAAADAAAAGAAATANVRARLGRSSYLGDRVLGHPDPGAQAVALWLAAIAGPVRS